MLANNDEQNNTRGRWNNSRMSEPWLESANAFRMRIIQTTAKHHVWSRKFVQTSMNSVGFSAWIQCPASLMMTICEFGNSLLMSFRFSSLKHTVLGKIYRSSDQKSVKNISYVTRALFSPATNKVGFSNDPVTWLGQPEMEGRAASSASTFTCHVYLPPRWVTFVRMKLRSVGSCSEKSQDND